MAKLGSFKTERLALPSTADAAEEDKAYVTLRNELILGDVQSFSPDLTDAEKAVALLAQVITDWNFTEDGSPEGVKLPVTVENVNMLNFDDFTFLSDWMTKNLKDIAGGLKTEEKKTSTATSIPVTEAQQTA